MSKQQRLNKIVNLLNQNHFMKIQDLSKTLGVSTMTIRRDLNKLKSENLIQLAPSGAIIRPSVKKNNHHVYSLLTESVIHPDRKERIGRKAIELLEPDDSIIIDSGTTTEYFAKHISPDIPFTVLCYTLNILMSIHQKTECNIILAGGYYKSNTMLFESSEGISQIEKFRAQKAFVGATGFSQKLGVTCSNHGEPMIKQSVINSSQKKILLIDSSKFDLVRPCYFAKPTDFDTIITDDGIPDSYRKFMEEVGIELIIA